MLRVQEAGCTTIQHASAVVTCPQVVPPSCIFLVLDKYGEVKWRRVSEQQHFVNFPEPESSGQPDAPRGVYIATGVAAASSSGEPAASSHSSVSGSTSQQSTPRVYGSASFKPPSPSASRMSTPRSKHLTDQQAAEQPGTPPIQDYIPMPGPTVNIAGQQYALSKAPRAMDLNQTSIGPNFPTTLRDNEGFLAENRINVNAVEAAQRGQTPAPTSQNTAGTSAE